MHQHTHARSCTQMWQGNTRMLPADFLVRTLISVVVTSEGRYSTARHLDTHGILHYCVSESMCVCVTVYVLARCALGVGGRFHRRQHLLRVTHELFLDGPQVQALRGMLHVLIELRDTYECICATYLQGAYSQIHSFSLSGLNFLIKFSQTLTSV